MFSNQKDDATDVTTPDQERLPDSPVTPVTPERIAEILEAENLQYRLESTPVPSTEDPTTVVRTGFSNAAIAFSVDGAHLVCDSMWRGQVPTTDAPKLLGIANEWNQTQFTPTLRFFEAAGGGLAVSSHRQINVTEGLSRNQIGAFIMSTLDAVLGSFQWVEKQLPELVTWEENHEH